MRFAAPRVAALKAKVGDSLSRRARLVLWCGVGFSLANPDRLSFACMLLRKNPDGGGSVAN